MGDHGTDHQDLLDRIIRHFSSIAVEVSLVWILPATPALTAGY